MTRREPTDSLVVGVRVGHGLRYFGGLKHRIDDHTASAGGHCAVRGAIVDEEPQAAADLVGSQADSVGGVHGVVHGGDQLGEIRRE